MSTTARTCTKYTFREELQQRNQHNSERQDEEKKPIQLPNTLYIFSSTRLPIPRLPHVEVKAQFNGVEMRGSIKLYSIIPPFHLP